MSDHFATAMGDVYSGYRALKPPRRVSISQGAANNLVIKQPGSAGGAWSADETPYMPGPMDMLASRSKEAVVFVGPARTGKCLDVDTPIPTPTGWTKMRDLVVGDLVFGTTGAPTRVLAVHPVKYELPCYEVKFSDGSTLVADSEHLWGVERFYWKAPNWRSEVKTTEQLLSDFRYSMRADGGGRYRYRVRNTAPLTCPEKNYPIDPYILGAWLGTGSSGQATLSSHDDDVAHYEDAFRRAGHTATSIKDGLNTSYTRADLIADGNTNIFGSLVQRLRCMNLLGNKHIPKEYLRGSFAQRQALLQGLMDTDGYAGGDKRAALEFSTANENLVPTFCELVRSLGMKPVATKKQTTWVYLRERKFGEAWRITFSANPGIDVFTLARKRDAFCAAGRDIAFRQIVDICPVASRPVRCIQVDAKNSLFLAGEGMVPTHNTAGLLLGWLAHNVVNDPGDMLLMQMTKDKAREFSKTDVDRAMLHSPNIAAMKSPRITDANTFDTLFRHGMWLRIAWPTVSNVSGSTYRYVAITDLDRIENAENVDGEGPLFALALKRTTTFLSRGMCLAESSPGIELTDPSWKPATRHEAPPVTGILGIYNRSDRRRWYWQCPDCKDYFEAAPGMGLFHLPPDEQLVENIRELDIAQMAKDYGSRIICPCCGVLIPAAHKNAMNKRGVWLAEGQTIDEHGVITGEPSGSSIAGYWLGGVAATYQPWKSLVERHLQGLRDYALTGSEETLKATTNTDQGMPYMSQHLVESSRKRENGGSLDESAMQRYVVPEQTRCLIASVDVQGGVTSRFVVQIHAVGPYREQWLVDRFEIKLSRREGMGAEFAPIDPASYPEDWDVLTEKLLRATWKTPTQGREMRLKLLVVDSGGEDGVTANAYTWFRRVRKAGVASRVRLYKGASIKDAPVIKESMVGRRNVREKGDVPLLVCNPNLLSDIVDSGLKRADPGPGYIHFPAARHPTTNPGGWLPQSFFDELTSEVRGKNGAWAQIRKRNESFDLCRMMAAGLLHLGLDKVRDWNVVPAWLAPLDQNSEVVDAEDRRAMQANAPLPSNTPPEVRVVPRQVRRPRRSAASSYIG